MDVIWAAFGLVLILEGIGPLLFPRGWQHYLRKIAAEPAASVRQMGAILVGAGCLMLIWLNWS